SSERPDQKLFSKRFAFRFRDPMVSDLSMINTQDQNEARIKSRSTPLTTMSARMNKPTGVKVATVSDCGPTNAACTAPVGAASGADFALPAPDGAATGALP